MELNGFERQGAVAHRHRQTRRIPRCDLQVGRQLRIIDHPAVVMPDLDRRLQPRQHAFRHQFREV